MLVFEEIQFIVLGFLSSDYLITETQKRHTDNSDLPVENGSNISAISESH